MRTESVRPPNGPVCRLVRRERDCLQAYYRDFRERWDRRDLSAAMAAFDRFHEAFTRHMRWEEESLFEEWEKRCPSHELRAVRKHHQQHELAEELLGKVDQLLGRRYALGPAIDDDVTVLLYALENAMVSHSSAELTDVAARLDPMLSVGEVAEIADELETRGRPHS